MSRRICKDSANRVQNKTNFAVFDYVLPSGPSGLYMQLRGCYKVRNENRGLIATPRPKINKI